MKRFYRSGMAALVLSLSMLLVFAACGGDDETTDAGGAAAPAEPVVVPTVSDTGSISAIPTSAPADTSMSGSDTSTSDPVIPHAPGHDDAGGAIGVERLIISDAPPSSESSNP